MASDNGLGIAISEEHLELADSVQRLVARAVPIYGGATEVQLNVIGERTR